MTKQPEALRLADVLDAYHTAAHHKQAAAELRRLHAANQAMLEALKCLMQNKTLHYTYTYKIQAAIAKGENT